MSDPVSRAHMSPEAVSALLDAVRVCVIGDVMLDRYSYGTVDRISPEAPVPVMQIQRQEEVSGGAANVFANLTTLGVRAHLVGITGMDADGARLRALCDDAARLRGRVSLLPMKGRPTTVKHRMTTTMQQVLRVDHENTAPIEGGDIERAWSLILESSRDAHVIIVADYAKGFMVPELSARLTAHARSRNIPIVVDTKPSHFKNFVGATLFTPNEKETTQLFPGVPFEEAGRALAQLCQGNILATRGARGMHYFPHASPHEEFAIPAIPTDVRDVSGAGDTVTAVAGALIAGGVSAWQFADISNRAASVVVSKQQTAVLTRAELLAVMRGAAVRTTQEASRIVDPTQIRSVVAAWQSSGERVGCLSGSFDVMGAYHYRVLAEARTQCDRLVVLLNSDTSVRNYKGAGKPTLHQDERAYMLLQSRAVDAVVIFDEMTPLRILESVQPNIFFNNSEWGADCIERPTVEAYGGVVIIPTIVKPDTWAASSSALRKKIIESEAHKTRTAVFLDRDGTLNDNKDGYLHRFEDITILPGVIEGLQALTKAGHLLIVVTNQSGVGRGMYPESDVQALHTAFEAHLREHGITIHGWYYCPHTPQAGCTCRKPDVGMLLAAAQDHNLNLSKCWFIGDSELDVGAARNSNMQSILIDTTIDIESWRFRPQYRAADFKSATDIILKS